MNKLFLALVILVSPYGNSIAAEIYVKHFLFNSAIIFEGSIVKGDADKLRKIIFNKENISDDGAFIGRLRVTSQGGDVDEAIKIGQLIRKLNISVWAQDYCSSACFIIYSSAVARSKSGDARFLLHRPYFDKRYYSELSLEQAQYKYKKLKEKYENYLLSVGVPKSLVDEMMQYNSDSSLEKSENEIINILGWFTPSTEEWLLAKCGNLQPNEKRDLLQYLSKSYTCEETYTSLLGISMGYCNYLLNKGQEIESCRSDALQAERRKIYKSEM